jgi:hypothetical protein
MARAMANPPSPESNTPMVMRVHCGTVMRQQKLHPCCPPNCSGGPKVHPKLNALAFLEVLLDSSEPTFDQCPERPGHARPGRLKVSKSPVIAALILK